jgi:hypothetical protein
MDYYQRPLEIVLSTRLVTVRSAGVDGKLNTIDDFIAQEEF